MLICSLAVAFAFCGCGNQKAEARVVRIGIPRGDLHYLAYYVASEKGFFGDEGLEVRETGEFNTDTEVMSSFSAGELDMGYSGVSPIITFAARGMADVEIVAQANRVGSAIVVRNGLEAGGVEALKGRTIAVPGYSTLQDFLLRIALKKADVSEDEVNIVVVKPPEMVSALSGGGVDAACASEPYPSFITANNAGRLLVKSSSIWAHHPCCMVVADRSFLEKNHDTVKRVVAAHAKAIDYINENPLEAADMAHLFTDQPRDVASSAMKNMEFSYKPDLKDIERYAKFLSGRGVIEVEDVEGSVRELVDTGFLPEDGS